MRLLLLDIESSPHLSYTWGTWNQNVAPSQLMTHGRTLCWAAKWLDKDTMYYMDERKGTERMVRKVHELLTQADGVITYNGLKFDIPMLNNEFIKLGLDPIPPQKHIDLYRVARSQFKLASNKLEFVATYLKVGEKVQNKGFGLWLGVMANKPKDWANMKKYNIGDVLLLEKVYAKLRPWIKNHPDVAVEKREEHCAACGSEQVQRRGIRRTKMFTIVRLHCQECGAWTDGTKKKIK